MPEKEFPKIVVWVLIYDDDGNIWLWKSAKWSDTWVVPGGHLEWGESLEEALKREVKEETNLDIDTIKFLYFSEQIFPPQYAKKKHMIFFNYSAHAVHKNVWFNEEFQEFTWVKPSDALNLNLNLSSRNFVETYINQCTPSWL